MIERLLERLPRGSRAVAWLGILVGIARVLDRAAAALDPQPGRSGRDRRHRDRARDRRSQPRRAAARLGGGGDRRPRDRARLPGDAVERRPSRPGGRLVGATRRHAPVRDPARVRRDGRHLLGAERRREHRPRGDDALGRVLRHPRRRQAELVAARAPVRGAGRRSCSRSSTRSLRSTCARTRSSAGSRSTSSRSGSPATCSSTSTAARERRRTSPRSRTSTSASWRTGTSSGPCSAS